MDFYLLATFFIWIWLLFYEFLRFIPEVFNSLVGIKVYVGCLVASTFFKGKA
jgi:hypothetical protein